MNEELENYMREHTDPEDQLLHGLNRETHAKILHPRMISGHLQGKLLTLISKMIQPEVAVEVGTFTGYASICLARGLKPGGVLHTIEINDELIEFASKYFLKAGLSTKIQQHVGDAREILSKIRGPVDLVFIDGDKDQYLSYYNMIFPNMKPGGIILADNVLWSGKVLERTSENDKYTKGIKEFNTFIKNDERVEKVIIPIRDGLTLIRKK